MTQITLDQATIDRLRAAGELAQILDPQRATVGYFESAEMHVYEEGEEGEVPEFDEAELDRREQRWQGIPSDEVRRRLEKLR